MEVFVVKIGIQSTLKELTVSSDYNEALKESCTVRRNDSARWSKEKSENSVEIRRDVQNISGAMSH
jgi:hypothetical protein